MVRYRRILNTKVTLYVCTKVIKLQNGNSKYAHAMSISVVCVPSQSIDILLFVHCSFVKRVPGAVYSWRHYARRPITCPINSLSYSIKCSKTCTLYSGNKIPGEWCPGRVRRKLSTIFIIYSERTNRVASFSEEPVC